MSEWTKRHRKKAMRNDVAAIMVKEKGFSLAHGCHFTPELVDIYTAPQGAGKGIKVALVPSETGEFKLHSASSENVKTDQRMIHCKALVSELKCIYDSYPCSSEVVHGVKALIITVKVKSTLGGL